MSDDVTGELSRLINAKRWYDAISLANQHKADWTVNGSAHFWFAGGLANELVGNHAEAIKWFKEASHCDDFTMQMQGDLLRDMALAVARQRRFDKAFDLLYRVREIFEGDANRLASVDMFLGRIEYFRGHFRLAEEYHWHADKIWRALGDDADQQWVMNNRFYWLKVQATMGLPMRRLYRDFLHSPEPRKDRRSLARLYFKYGPLGVLMGAAAETASPPVEKMVGLVQRELAALDGMYDGLTG